MNLPDVKQLDKIIALCRKRGVSEIQIGDLRLTLSESAPIKAKKPAKTATKAAASTTPDAPIETDEPTEEELLFWSVGDAPQTEEPNQ